MTKTAKARLDGWEFAAAYIGHITEVAHLIGVPELTEVLERAEGEALEQRSNSTTTYAEAIED